jgi:acyl-CoA reductase-like NAD-dependent aldehyde dehydrogenase
MAETTEVGPMVSPRQRERVLDYIEIARGEGATVVSGGGAPDDPALAEGAYVEPTIFDGVSPDARIATEEVFGPVVAVVPFDDEDDAVRIANTGPYGLSGSVWTRDLGRALRVCRGIEAGNLSVNSHSSVRYWTPFGGFKQSGLGRELGPDAPDAFTEVKNVFIATDG